VLEAEILYIIWIKV